MENKMEIGKIKIYGVLTCGPEESAKDVSNKMKKHKDRRVFVVGEDEKLIGIITSSDLVYKVLAEGCADKKAKEIMTKDVKGVDVKEELEKALEVMNELKT